MAERKEVRRDILVRIVGQTQIGNNGRLARVIDPDAAPQGASVAVYIPDPNGGEARTKVEMYPYTALEIVQSPELPPLSPSPNSRSITYSAAVAYIESTAGAVTQSEVTRLMESVETTGHPFRCKIDATPLAHLFCGRGHDGKAQWYIEYPPKEKS